MSVAIQKAPLPNRGRFSIPRPHFQPHRISTEILDTHDILKGRGKVGARLYAWLFDASGVEPKSFVLKILAVSHLDGIFCAPSVV
jgi:hypothetical protein